MRKCGRPPAGIDGKQVQDYPQLSIRMPVEKIALARAMSKFYGQPVWRMMMRLIEDSVEGLPAESRTIILKMSKEILRSKIKTAKK